MTPKLNQLNKIAPIPEKTLVIYHDGDPDGKMGAGIAQSKLGNDAFYLGLNYESFGAKELLSIFGNLKTIYFIDYLLPADDVKMLLDHRIELIILDHHVSSIEGVKEGMKTWDKYLVKEYLHDLPDNPDYKKSGTMLAWEYFYKDKNCVPFAVQLVSAYDAWNTSSLLFKDARYFTRYLLHQMDKPISYFFYAFLATPVDYDDMLIFIETGRAITEITQKNEDALAKKYAGTLEWEGLRFCALNTRGVSQTVDSVFSPEKHDAVLLYIYSPEVRQWRISLYHNSNSKSFPDLSIIAKKFPGGGGHKAACGFSVDELPFKVEDIHPLDECLPTEEHHEDAQLVERTKKLKRLAKYVYEPSKWV